MRASLMLAACLVLQMPVAKTEPDDTRARQQFKEWASLNADAIQAAQKVPKVKRARTYNTALLKRNQEFCKKHSLNLLQLEALVLKGVDEKWPVATEAQAKQVAEAAEKIKTLRVQGDAIREQIILEQEIAAYIDRVSRERRASQPRVTSAASVAGRLQSAGPTMQPSDVPIGTCNFPMSGGLTCKRKVAGGGLCYQHR